MITLLVISAFYSDIPREYRKKNCTFLLLCIKKVIQTEKVKIKVKTRVISRTSIKRAANGSLF